MGNLIKFDGLPGLYTLAQWTPTRRLPGLRTHKRGLNSVLDVGQLQYVPKICLQLSDYFSSVEVRKGLFTKTAQNHRIDSWISETRNHYSELRASATDHLVGPKESINCHVRGPDLALAMSPADIS